MQEGSYLIIERGMPVRGTDGDIGTVTDVIADPSVDIFRGIVIAHGLLPPRHGVITPERILSVSGGAVYVNFSKGETDSLPLPSAVDM